MAYLPWNRPNLVFFLELRQIPIIIQTYLENQDPPHGFWKFPNWNWEFIFTTTPLLEISPNQESGSPYPTRFHWERKDIDYLIRSYGFERRRRYLIFQMPGLEVEFFSSNTKLYLVNSDILIGWWYNPAPAKCLEIPIAVPPFCKQTR